MGRKKNKKQRLINREISWLSFNHRVLQEAADPDVPLLERLKFLGIFSSNLDEFFRVRISSLQRMVEAGIKPDSVYGGNPNSVLKQIQKHVVVLRGKYDKIFANLERELEGENVFIVSERELNEEQARFVQRYFDEEVRAALFPVMLDSAPEFPYLQNQVIYLAIRMAKSGVKDTPRYAIVRVPVEVLPRFTLLPSDDKRQNLIMLDDVIRFGLKSLFSAFGFDEIGAYTIKITRDAELDIDDDVGLSALEQIAKSVKKRNKARAVRFVYDHDMPKDLLSFILDKSKLTKLENIIPGGRYHNARDFMDFPSVGPAHLRYENPRALVHPRISKSMGVLEAIRGGDILLHHPYHSFAHVADLLQRASIDPNVRSIKMTLYRLARNSRVVNALVNALRNGKKVMVLLELRARFDEEANIQWIRELEQEGARVLSGVPGLKVHAKLCMITRKESGKLVDYALVGTGNYNEVTAKIFADHTLLTADKRITSEVGRVFDFLRDNYKTFQFKHLVVSPFQTRKRFAKLIRREIRNAKDGKENYIWVKLNSLIDRSIIDELYEASRAGVKVRMIVRGVCSLIPGVKGLSENIEVTSIVDKYLEHSRIFLFCNGGDEIVYIASGDWMQRNLDHRVEVAVPILDAALREELKTYLAIQFRDSIKARCVNEKQDNQIRANHGKDPHRAQVEIYEWLRERAAQ